MTRTEFIDEAKRNGVDLEEQALGVAANLNALHLITYIQYELTVAFMRGMKRSTEATSP